MKKGADRLRPRQSRLNDYGRRQEHLGSADAAISMMRRLLMRLAHDLEKGKAPYAATHGEIMTLRSAGLLTGTDVSFVEASEPRVRVGPRFA